MNASVSAGAEAQQDAGQPGLDHQSASNACSRRATSR